MAVVYAAVILFSLQAVFAANKDFAPPKFVVNLDQPAKERWREVGLAYKQYVPAILDILNHYIPDQYMGISKLVGEELSKHLDPDINDELKGLAKVGGIAHGYLVLMNLLYDFSAHEYGGFKACTSIIAKDPNGNMYHARNLDYSFGDVLRNVTIVVDFQKRHRTVYTTTTFAYYTGAMNGQRPRAFTISIDERDQGPFWENMIMMVFTGLRNPLGFAVRKALETTTSYSDAVKYLSNVHLTAPCYIIIAGTRPNQGIVITRDRMDTKDKWTMKEAIGGWYLLETNYDHWGPPGDDRRLAGEKAMNATGQANINPDTMYQVLSTSPVLNGNTIYTIVMQAANPVLYYQTVHIRTP